MTHETNSTDPYGRNQMPLEKKDVSPFSLMRPLRYIAFGLLWFIWRSLSLEPCKWNGTRASKSSVVQVDHSDETLAITFTLFCATVLVGLIFKMFLVPCGVFVSFYLVLFIVRTAFKLHDVDARLYWSNKLLK